MPHEVLVGRNEGDRTSIAFPGGALGVPAAVLAAINVQLFQPWKDAGDPRYRESLELLSFKCIMHFAEQIFGGMSCHTDDHNEKDALACRGCGHAMGLLENTRYGLGEHYSAEFRTYAISLKERAGKKDPKVTLYAYRGPHREQAVMRVQSKVDTGRYLCIRPTDGQNGVFIVNEVMGIRILTDFTATVYEELKQSFERLGVSRTELLDHVRSTYRSHVRRSASRLAAGFPVYDVSEEAGQVIVHKSSLRF
jgi:hypothetical protein